MGDSDGRGDHLRKSLRIVGRSEHAGEAAWRNEDHKGTVGRTTRWSN